jgi:hypothetical protein
MAGGTGLSASGPDMTGTGSETVAGAAGAAGVCAWQTPLAASQSPAMAGLVRLINIAILQRVDDVVSRIGNAST